jgi:erythromycin esterase-like protein
VLPTTDADRFSVDVEQLSAGSAEIEGLLEAAAAENSDRRKVEEARAQIAAIIRKIVPLSPADRERLSVAVDHARALGARYVAFLEHDREVFEARNQLGAEELGALLESDRPVLA